jgi:hypothetical protein
MIAERLFHTLNPCEPGQTVIGDRRVQAEGLGGHPVLNAPRQLLSKRRGRFRRVLRVAASTSRSSWRSIIPDPTAMDHQTS